MEHKIGEIFEFDGEWYQCVEGNDCANCVFIDYCKSHTKKERDDTIGLCVSFDRNDGMHVIFKKLEKVGEPFSCDYYGDSPIMMQEYNLYNLDDVTNEDNIPMYITDYRHKRIAIELKQTKEDMEEKIQHYDCFFDKKKSNLKPFNLEAAKQGKPVCTRDGRKARIICFDAKRKDEKSIIALVPSKDYPGFEDLIAYPNNGNYHGGHENDGDLMILPEKKEGWVNVYKGGLLDTKSYPTKKEAFDKASWNNYVDTVKINWEE